ncbi:KUP/HAK/KT family potassium transporter, partial [Rhizobium sp. 25PS6]|uniref:KUP/HAK/KT family potassium transporter n=1 Tax=Rhizobium sp. 25PS6 TaxID=3075622 RepID=UPI0028FDAA96
DPSVLGAVNPVHALWYIANNIGSAIAVLGAVFLAVTGAEALYVDLGHFGRRPIVTAWFSLVFPSLLLNYFGQGAFVLANPQMAEHPFFSMHPEWARIPMVCLATAATVIASQAVISGAYSLVRQAMHLNLLPRLRILHTSETQSGQIFMPQVNNLLFIFVAALVLFFQNSSGLSAAYGIAVTGEMFITSILLFIVMRRIWSWKLATVLAVIVPISLIDAGFLAANIAKFADGGWVPVAVATTMALIMQTWTAGRRLLAARTKADEIPLSAIIDNLARKKPPTVPGTAMFLT